MATSTRMLRSKELFQEYGITPNFTLSICKYSENDIESVDISKFNDGIITPNRNKWYYDTDRNYIVVILGLDIRMIIDVIDFAILRECIWFIEEYKLGSNIAIIRGNAHGSPQLVDRIFEDMKRKNHISLNIDNLLDNRRLSLIRNNQRFEIPKIDIRS